jgi:dTDP-3-amino-3,4,6-trideoxy-alpha-D-glucose transaminase
VNWKSLLLRHHRRVAPAIDLAARAYRAGVLSYDAFDEHNAEVAPALGRELAEVLSARGTVELWAYPKRFEARFAALCGKRYAVGTASGTAALQLALLAGGVRPGDEVVTSAHTYIATVLAIQNVGAVPVLVDPDPCDLCIRADAVARALTPRTRAIVPVHMHGHVADMPALLELAARRGILVVEDCAQAHGAQRGGRVVPVGPTGCFSFYATKPLGGAGNGGLLVTDDPEIARRAEIARDPDGADPLVAAFHRTPSYLDALEAAVLTARLPRLDAWRARREAHAAAYAAALPDLDAVRPASGVTSAWYSFVVRVADRDEVKRRMLLAGVETRVEYAASLVTSPTLAGYGWRPEDFPVALDAARRGLSLPLHPFLSPEQHASVVRALRGAVGRSAPTPRPRGRG